MPLYHLIHSKRKHVPGTRTTSPSTPMKISKKQHAGLDPKIVGIIDMINQLPFATTLSSCAGYGPQGSYYELDGFESITGQLHYAYEREGAVLYGAWTGDLTIRYSHKFVSFHNALAAIANNTTYYKYKQPAWRHNSYTYMFGANTQKGLIKKWRQVSRLLRKWNKT